MRTIRESGAIEAAIGERLDLVVTRPVGIPEQLQVEWPVEPAIDGDAVRFISRCVVAPSPEDDGGVTAFHYELETVRPGAARVTLAPKPASREAVRPPVILDVTVRDAAPR